MTEQITIQVVAETVLACTVFTRILFSEQCWATIVLLCASLKVEW